MPTTSDGSFVYADPDRVVAEVQSDPDTFSLSTTGTPSEWVQFIESKQVSAKQRIDNFCGRDFENHTGATLSPSNLGGSRYLDLPTPIQSITAVREDGTALATDRYHLLGDAGQLVYLDEDGDPDHWPDGVGVIEIDLDYGYAEPPADVAEAEQKLVTNGIANLAQIRAGMVVQQDDVDLQVSLPSAMTTEIRAMLKPYRMSGNTAAVL